MLKNILIPYVYLFDWIFNLYISHNKQIVVFTRYISQSILIVFYHICHAYHLFYF